jgi:hypothetical protein
VQQISQFIKQLGVKVINIEAEQLKKNQNWTWMH